MSTTASSTTSNGAANGTTSSTHNYDSIGTTASIVLLGFIGYMFLLFLPALIGGFVDTFGFSPEQAGLIASSHLVGTIAGALFVSVFLSRLNLKLCLVVAALAEAALLAATTQISNIDTMYAVQFAAGCASGIISTIALSCIALTSNADRVTGLVILVQFLIAGAALSFIHLVSFHQSLYIMAACVGLSSLLALGMPKHIVGANPEHSHDHDGNTTFTLPIILALLALLAFYTFNNGIWAFLDRIAVSLEIPPADIATGLGLSMLGGLLGAAVATVLGNRFGRSLPSTIGMVLISATAVFLLNANAGDSTMFYAVCFMFNAMLALVVPYVLAFCAEQDQSGRAMSLANLCLACGIAAGPAVAAMLISGDSYNLLLTVSAVGMAACLLPMLLAYKMSNSDVAEAA